MFGIYGIEPTVESVRILKETGACGIVLQRRNIESAEQVKNLIAGLQQRVGHRLLVGVEQEGGTLIRFARDITPFPGHMALGKSATASLAFEVGRAMAQELLPLGINVNLAPVLDVQPAGYRRNLGMRSFGSDPAIVATMGAQMIKGLQSGGLSAVAKHFPGEGAVPEKGGAWGSRSDAEQTHVVPFKSAVQQGPDVIMTSLAGSGVWESVSTAPAVLSRAVVRTLLRETLGYNGVVMTDDLTSPDLAGGRDPAEATLKAARAGNDILYLAHDGDTQMMAFQAYRAALEKDQPLAKEAEESHRRIQELLDRRTWSQVSLPTTEEADSVSLSEVIAGASVHIERDPLNLLPIPGAARCGILFPRLTDVGHQVVIDDELRDIGRLMQTWIRDLSSCAELLECPMDPRDNLVSMISDWTASIGTVVFFCFNAKEYPGQRRILEELERQCERVILVPMGNPWDRELASKKTTIVQSLGFRVPQLAAAIEVLFRPR